MSEPAMHDFDVHWSAETDSTNIDAAEHLRAGGGSAVFATDFQRAGRGRLDRGWEAPSRANLLVSIALRPGGPVTAWGRYTNALALAALDAIGDDRVGIKWPNDLVTVDGQKLGGMLAEVVPRGLVLGIGINVGWPATTADQPRASSLALLGCLRDRATMLDALLVAFDRWCGVAAADLQAAYRARCFTIGAAVRVELTSGEHLVGRATSLTEQGELVVEVRGKARVITVGDVFHLRPS